MTDDDRQTDRFEAAFRKWASREPSTSAADAARRVAAQADAAGRPAPAVVWAQRVAVACGLVLVVTSGVLLWRSHTPSQVTAPAADVTPVLPDNVVIFWLDAETPVYFVVGPANDHHGGTP